MKSVREGRSGLSVARVFTSGMVSSAEGYIDPLDTIKWGRRNSRIDGRDGGVVFEMLDVEAPEFWSQNAVDIAASKYFRKAGVEGRGHEHSVRQLVHRVSRSIRLSGERQDYFASSNDADAFEAELAYVLVTQRAAFNSPVWFNCGLRELYGITGSPSGSYRWYDARGEVVPTVDSYTYPQVSACFINKITDDLMDIAEHIKREMRIFKHGSGAGANFSALRAKGERLSNGGRSSGLMSFLEVFDRAAGAIKSGGTTRRAAKMVSLDVDHPDIEEFIGWKAREEDKALALMRAGFGTDLDGEAFRTVSGQNANNSVRVTDQFMRAATTGGSFDTRWRTSGDVAATKSAGGLLRKIAEAAHRCADPGMQYDTTINRWHPCSDTTRINGSNPCSEFMYVDDSACNLSSINLVHYLDVSEFMVAEFRHTCRLLILAQEILVDHASYPTDAIAKNSHDHRPLGLGYANLGGLLMRMGVPYDSDKGRRVASAVTAMMTGEAYTQSAEIAATKGAFSAFKENRSSFLSVMEMHREACHTLPHEQGPDYRVLDAARKAWDVVMVLGREHGFRNAQTTLLAPTGTIGLMMDCDTTGVEPDFSLVKHKKLAGGGAMKFVNQSVAPALLRLGYSPPQVSGVLSYLDEHETVEGCDTLDPRHLSVFDCSVRCGERGTRFIAPMGHVRMMSAVQPFLSGAISKTVNVPNEATVEDIEALYVAGWNSGLKALAIYRDGSKTFQVLNNKLSDDKVESAPQQRRARLPDKRVGHTYGLRVGGQKIYLRTGLYVDGSVGEIFIDMHKEGAFTRSMTNCFAIAISLGLQHGVPLSTFVDRFSFTNFAPNGPVQGHPNVKFAGSVIDLIMRVMAVEHLDRVDLAQIKPNGYDEDVVPAKAIKQTADSTWCDNCGSLTRRNGTCFVCDNCGSQTGCA